MRRLITIVSLLALMAGFGFGVNRWFASRQTRLEDRVDTSIAQTVPQFTLPGTVYISQDGSLYAINGTSVTKVNLPSSPKWSWVQPHVLSNGTLLVIKQYAQFSDMYHITSTGRILSQLTNNYSNVQVQYNHWIFWPTTTANGKTVFFSSDSPKPEPGASYEVDFTVWSAPANRVLSVQDTGITPGKSWSIANDYTGGDVQPSPLANGGVLYTAYQIDDSGQVFSEVTLQPANAELAPIALTTPAQNCGDSMMSPNGTTVAMLCDNGRSSVNLDVATLHGTTLSAPRVLVKDCLCNSESWSPTGTDLLYMNSTQASGYFGLWYIAGASEASAVAPREITQNSVDLDATSAAAWYDPGAVISTPSAQSVSSTVIPAPTSP